MLAVTLAFIGLEVTSQPGFCNCCHIMNRYYDSWKASAHNDASCIKCHLEPGFVNYMKGKMAATTHPVNYFLGRVPPKPNARVEDVSCLRSDCHSSEALAAKEINNNGLKFTHKGHISKVVHGIEISCGTCHSGFEGDEHFEVNTQVCYICHLEKGGAHEDAVGRTGCRDCHEVPSKVIKRGLVDVSHQKFVSYEARCDGACHVKQRLTYNSVADAVCLNCHSFRNEHEANSVELHAIHSQGEKVECFACHGEITHGFAEDGPVTAIADCGNCHDGAHEIQRSIYTAQSHLLNKQADRVLNPMFVTHVGCTGCHVEQTEKDAAGTGCVGMVAKATPEACDNCHSGGTGERYIPFWQEKIRGLHKQISRKVDAVEEQMGYNVDGRASEKIGQARSILKVVSDDGSWGVHNFKYTEAMLLKANEIVNGLK